MSEEQPVQKTVADSKADLEAGGTPGSGGAQETHAKMMEPAEAGGAPDSGAAQDNPNKLMLIRTASMKKTTALRSAGGSWRNIFFQFCIQACLAIVCLRYHLGYKNEYCAEPLARWCLIMSIGYFIAVVLALWRACMKALESQSKKSVLLLLLASIILLIFNIVMLIIGSVWVFAIPDAAEGKACSPELYSFIWWFVVISWATLGFFFCCGCCAVCLLCSAGAAEAANQ
jgi:hypothetical protein